MFQEAVTAIRQGERNRARDLLTRLIKADRNQARYWLWMSTVVETSRERIFCLKEVLRIDPEHSAARRGLILLGAAPPDDRLAVPLRLQKRSWQGQLQSGETPAKLIGKLSRVQIGALAVVAIVLVGLVLSGVFTPKPEKPVASLSQATALPFATPEPTETQPLPTETPSPSGPVPLVMLLEATYTPTPLYVNTPHPRSEAYRSALFAYQRGSWAEMLNYMNQVSTLEPLSPDVYYYIGEAHRFQNRYPEALKAYNKALEISQAFAPAYMGRARAVLGAYPARWREATADFEKAIEYDANLSDAYLELARIELEQNQPQKVLERLEPVARLAPDSMLLYYYRAHAHLALEEPELALADALRINAIDMTFLPGYRLVGHTYQLVGDTGKALDALLMYTRYIEDDGQAYSWLGQAYLARGEKDQAFEAFNRAIGLDGRLPEAYLNRGRLYLERVQPDQAVADLKQAQRMSAQSFPVNMALAQAYMLQQRWSTAYSQLENTEEFAETSSEKAEVYYYRAQVLENLGEMAAAGRDWNALLLLEDADIPASWRAQAEQRIAVLQTPTHTPVTPSATSTRMPTHTATATWTPRPTFTPTFTPTSTSTRLPTATFTLTATRQPTATYTSTATRKPTLTATFTVTPRPSASVTPTPK